MTSKAFLFRLVLSGHVGSSHRLVPSPQWKLVYKPTLQSSKAAQSVGTSEEKALQMAKWNVDVRGRTQYVPSAWDTPQRESKSSFSWDRPSDWDTQHIDPGLQGPTSLRCTILRPKAPGWHCCIISAGKQVSETCSVMRFTQPSFGCDRSKCLSGWFSFWCRASSMRSIKPESLGWFQQEVHYHVTMPMSFFPICSTNATNVHDTVRDKTVWYPCIWLLHTQFRPVASHDRHCQSFSHNALSCPWFQMNKLGCISGLPHKENPI